MVAKDQRKWHVTEGTEGIHDAIESHTSNVNEETATVMKTDKSEEQLDMMITREELMKKKKENAEKGKRKPVLLFLASFFQWKAVAGEEKNVCFCMTKTY